MFNSLSEFYNSDTWRKFRAGLIASRVNPADGLLYDEHDGKPLLKAYDIIAHHKTPLTMANVNDASVSLNPENIMLVSMRSHNEIHGRFGYGSERKVYYVYGAPCSGKSTYVQTVKGNSDLVVDMDLIWQCVTGGELYVKPPALKTNAFMVRDALFDAIKRRAGKWERAWIITGGAVRGARDRQIQEFSAEPIFIPCDRLTCLQRLENDQKRPKAIKDEWRQYIDEWFDAYTE